MTRITPDPRVRFGCMASWVRCRFVRKRGFENRDVALEDGFPLLYGGQRRPSHHALEVGVG